jgi:hypothetical protein
VLYEKKSAMVYVTLNRTMEQAMSVENEACASRLCSADMKEASAAFFAKRRPDCRRRVLERGVPPGPMSTLQPLGYPVQLLDPVLSLIEPTTTRA